MESLSGGGELGESLYMGVRVCVRVYVVIVIVVAGREMGDGRWGWGLCGCLLVQE